MYVFIAILLGVFIVYEIAFKDAFGIRHAVINHFKNGGHGLYGIVVSLVLPITFLYLFKETHVYTANNLDNLLIVLSIFVSILFGIMGDISGKEMPTQDGEELKKLTLSSAIFISTECLISMILTFGLMTAYPSDVQIDTVFKVLNLFNFYLVFSILINTLMILQRFGKLIRND